ncbi:MAG: type II toxin-antitoxin system VapC family toxin [Candidatus Lokiarchaeota archaeon]|nr:type II toxin-antitoxin system VapC family toxin [Candidatus Lokiarchaeota archaeon]
MIVADTTVIIDIARGKEGVKRILDELKEEEICISSISLEEIYAGLGHSLSRLGVEKFPRIMEKYEKVMSQFRPLAITDRLLNKAGMFRGEFLAKGFVINPADAIIAVTAETANASAIVTRNPNHFKDVQVRVTSYSI